MQEQRLRSLHTDFRASAFSTQLIMKTEPENEDRTDCSEVSAEDPCLSRPDASADNSMQPSAEKKKDLVSDENYPNYDILLDVAHKILKSFEDR